MSLLTRVGRVRRRGVRFRCRRTLGWGVYARHAHGSIVRGRAARRPLRGSEDQRSPRTDTIGKWTAPVLDLSVTCVVIVWSHQPGRPEPWSGKGFTEVYPHLCREVAQLRSTTSARVPYHLPDHPHRGPVPQRARRDRRTNCQVLPADLNVLLAHLCPVASPTITRLLATPAY